MTRLPALSGGTCFLLPRPVGMRFRLPPRTVGGGVVSVPPLTVGTLFFKSPPRNVGVHVPSALQIGGVGVCLPAGPSRGEATPTSIFHLYIVFVCFY